MALVSKVLLYDEMVNLNLLSSSVFCFTIDICLSIAFNSELFLVIFLFRVDF